MKDTRSMLYEEGEEVLVHRRSYGEAPERVMRVTIAKLYKQRATFRFKTPSGAINYGQATYDKLEKLPKPSKPKVMPATRFRNSPIAVEVPPKPKSTLPTAEPRSRTPHYQADGKVHVAEIVQKEPRPFRQSSVPPTELRAVPPAFASLMSTVEKLTNGIPKTGPTNGASVVASDASKPPSVAKPAEQEPKLRPSDASTELAAWLEMGHVLVEQVQKRLAALDDEAKLLRDQAHSLEEQAENCDREAAELRVNLAAISEFRKAAEKTAALILPSRQS